MLTKTFNSECCLDEERLSSWQHDLVLQVVWGLQLGWPPPRNHRLSIYSQSEYLSVCPWGNRTQSRELISSVLPPGGWTAGQQQLWLFPRGHRGPSSWWRVWLGPRVLAEWDCCLTAEWTKNSVSKIFEKELSIAISERVKALWFLYLQWKWQHKTKTIKNSLQYDNHNN